MRSLLLLLLCTPTIWADEVSEVADRMRLQPGLEYDFTIEKRSPNRSEAAMEMTSYAVRFPSPVESGIERNDTVPGTLFVPRDGADRPHRPLPRASLAGRGASKPT